MILNINEIPSITGIYKLEYENGKIYIGQALNIRARALEHNSKNKQVCDKALKKYNATLTVLQTNIPIDQLDIIETYWINKFESYKKEKGYNILIEGNASGKRGIENPNAAFNKEQLTDIINLLKYHNELSIKDIAEKYNVSSSVISRISNGIAYHQENLLYPLRRFDHTSMRKNTIEDYDISEQDILNLKEDLKYRWDLEIESNLTKKYNLPLRIVRDINNGRKFESIGNYEYPIRKKNIRNNNNFSYEDIINILNLLKNSNESMIEIGKKYKIGRDTVGKINKGLAYIIKDYQYPARLTK